MMLTEPTPLSRYPRQDPSINLDGGTVSTRRTSLFRFVLLASLVVLSALPTGCANVPRMTGRIRESREGEILALLKKVEAEPIRGCTERLPKAIASGRFADGPDDTPFEEITLLKNALADACRCKKQLSAARSDIAPVRLNDIGNSTLATLAAITNSRNQSPEVLNAASEALKHRLPMAGLDEISTLYIEDLTTIVNLETPTSRFKNQSVICLMPLRDYGSHYVTYPTLLFGQDPTLRQMITDRTRALQESAKALAALKQREDNARLAAEAQQKATAEREARTTKIREHLAVALKQAHQNDLDGAEEAIGQAKTLKEVDDQALQGEVDQALLAEIAAAGAVIAATPKAKQRARDRQREEARIERDADQKTREEQRKAAALERRATARGGSYVSVMLDWAGRIERDLRHLVYVFASLNPPAREPTWAEKEFVYAPMRQLCTTIREMRRKAPDVEAHAVDWVIGRIAITEGDRDAMTARGILGNYLEGDCYKTYRAAFSHR